MSFVKFDWIQAKVEICDVGGLIILIHECFGVACKT